MKNKTKKGKAAKKRIETIVNFALGCFIAVLSIFLCWVSACAYLEAANLIETSDIFFLGLGCGIFGVLGFLYLFEVLAVISKFVWYRVRGKPRPFWELTK